MTLNQTSSSSSSGDLGETVGFDPTSTPGGSRLAVRCPNCHEPTNIAVDTEFTDMMCSLCGTRFSLVERADATRSAAPLSSLGRFDLIERVGIGGFGSVWKAHDKQLDRTVAIKIPRQRFSHPDEQEKFFREARTAAQLRHPNIVSVHEVGRDNDSIYIVSEFVRGVTLADWLTAYRPTFREAAGLCTELADALQHAHEMGVIHRDLKPANIIIDESGEPHLTDFGLARREVGELTVTTDGAVIGTPAYMSPEQAQGEAHTAGPRSDVYSLGVMFFQLISGELPFRGSAPMVIQQVVDDPPPSPRKFNATIPKDLETLTLKCLEKEPLRRYQTAQELGSELRRFLKGEPIHARPVTQFERGWRWCKRNPVIATLSAAVLMLLATTAIVSSYAAAKMAIARSIESKAAEDRIAAIGNELIGELKQRKGRDIFEPHSANLREYFKDALKDEDLLSKLEGIRKTTSDAESVATIGELEALIRSTNQTNSLYLEPSIAELRDRVGKNQEVVMEVANVGGYGTFLYSMNDSKNPNCFAIEIKSNQQSAVLDTFGIRGWRDLMGRRVRASGPIESHGNAIQITVNDMSHFSVRSADGRWLQFKTPEEFIDPPVSVLRGVPDKQQTVTFRVVSVGGNDRRYLNSMSNYNDPNCFTVVVEIDQVRGINSLGDSDAFSGLLGKMIKVTGQISERKGALQLRITDLTQQLQVEDSNGQYWPMSDSSSKAIRDGTKGN